MDEDVTDNFRELVTPQDRLELERRLQREYAEAHKLLKECRYKDALKKFKWVFAKDLGDKLFLDNREIVALTKNYPPSKAVIKRWRNDKERLVLEQKADSSLVNQWHNLNLSLKEQNRTIDVLIKLQNKAADERLIHSILGCTWKKLAVAKRYSAIRGYLESLGFHLLLHAVQYDTAVLFPNYIKWTKRQQKEDIQRHFRYLLEDGVLSYEVALGLGEKHIASEFAKKILSVETSDRCYASLIKAAIRARTYPEARAMFEDAQKHFAPRRLRYSSKVIKTLPKTELAKLNTSRAEKVLPEGVG